MRNSGAGLLPTGTHTLRECHSPGTVSCCPAVGRQGLPRLRAACPFSALRKIRVCVLGLATQGWALEWEGVQASQGSVTAVTTQPARCVMATELAGASLGVTMEAEEGDSAVDPVGF